MSIPVDVARLAEALADFGSGYLLTTTGGRIKVVTVDPEVVDGAVRITGPGRGSLANIAGNDAVTLVFPPRIPRGYTLLVDGVAQAEGEDLVVTPSAGVLHRPAAHADAGPETGADTGADRAADPDGCGHDCRPV